MITLNEMLEDKSLFLSTIKNKPKYNNVSGLIVSFDKEDKKEKYEFKSLNCSGTLCFPIQKTRTISNNGITFRYG